MSGGRIATSTGLLWILALVAVAGLVGAGAIISANEEAVREFGSSSSEPLDEGFFFWKCEYVNAPYVVERRGLDIYINDYLVRRGPEWPPHDYTVEEDPGDPPPEVGPRDMYWTKKWRYLCANHDYETAKKKIFEGYQKCDRFSEVYWHDRDPSVIVVVDHSGKKANLGLSPPNNFKRELPDPEEMLRHREKKRTFFENRLRGNSILLMHSGASQISAGPEHTYPLLSILLSDKPDEQKVTLLKEKSMLDMVERPLLEKIVAGVRQTPQLGERFRHWNETLRVEGALEEARRTLRHIGEDLPITIEPLVKPVVDESVESSADSVPPHSLAQKKGEQQPAGGQAGWSGHIWTVIVGFVMLAAAGLVIILKRLRRTGG